MTIKLTVIFLVISNSLFAQPAKVSTKFDEFVKCSKIEWAAYASDTFRFDKAGFNNLLLTKLENKKIKATLPIESRTENINKAKFVSYDSIFQNHFTDNYEEFPVIDSNGEITGHQRLVPQVDTSAFKLTEVTQILFIQKGVLKSYIPWVTPTLPVVTSSGKYIGESFYFNTAYNRKYNRKPRRINKLLYLSQTNKNINLHQYSADNILKEMYGKNLIETLWPQVLNGKIDVFSIGNNERLTPEKLMQANAGTLVPFYDSTANATIYKYEFIGEPVSPEKFTDVELVQNWYYDARKNMVFSKILEMYLFTNKPDETEPAKSSPVLKLVFK
jgi:hypothetical protein